MDEHLEQRPLLCPGCGEECAFVTDYRDTRVYTDELCEDCRAEARDECRQRIAELKAERDAARGLIEAIKAEVSQRIAEARDDFPGLSAIAAKPWVEQTRGQTEELETLLAWIEAQETKEEGDE